MPRTGRTATTANPTIGENLPELCDGLDNDCDLVIDDGDFSGAGPDRLSDATGASEIAWGVGGTGSFRASDPDRTTAFRFRPDGTIVNALVAARTNPVSGYASLVNSAPPVAGCLVRDVSFFGPDTTRDGGGLCATDEECFQAVCVRNDVGSVGTCSASLDGRPAAMLRKRKLYRVVRGGSLRARQYG